MANLKSFDVVLNRTKKDETTKAPLIKGQFIIEGQRKNVRDFGLRVLHHNPYPTVFPYGNGMVLHFYQQQESSTTKTVHKVINKGLKTYV